MRRTILVLVLFLPTASGFTKSLNVRSASLVVRLRLAAEDNDKDTEPNGYDEYPSERIRRRLDRCVDYPSFVYSTKAEAYRIKRRPSETDVVATYKSPCDEPRTVSIPDAPTKPVSWYDRLVNFVTAPDSGFSSEFTQVSQAARETRLLKNRCYARREPFEADNIADPPSLADLSPPPPKPTDRLWVSYPFRIMSFVIPFFSLTLITKFLSSNVVTMPPEQLDEITSKFGPGISILYGTFVSLTLSILYNRQQAIQSTVTQESSLLVMMTRNLLTLFKDDKELAVMAGQCAADQIRTLVRGSRGGELMLMMYSDPYARMMELIELCENDLVAKGKPDMGGKGGLIAFCRDTLKEMNKFRGIRLSDEALALPPTHFVILNVLTSLILLGYVSSILPTVDAHGAPSLESSLLFGILCSVYVLFYNFSSDLNNPFRGVYQLRRSSIAGHLLEAKWLVANHPLLRGEVDFEEFEEEAAGDVLIRSPGLGELKFENKEAIFPDADTIGDEELDDSS